jgi:hypothetical protein
MAFHKQSLKALTGKKRQSLYSCDHVLARSRLPVILNIDNEQLQGKAIYKRRPCSLFSPLASISFLIAKTSRLALQTELQVGIVVIDLKRHFEVFYRS